MMPPVRPGRLGLPDRPGLPDRLGLPGRLGLRRIERLE